MYKGYIYIYMYRGYIGHVQGIYRGYIGDI